ncbi:hypothetical protein [Paenibacillus sp. NPDC058174]|uniref:hypothetical protein n=1 Tax=Paenibacillus sp. NPDC058174 TaxID=3346366 RepID=UPI0036D7B97F
MLKKKLIILALTLVLSLTGVTSAFAYDGWADSKQTAYQLQAPVLGVTTVLNTPYDVDWYSWTNNTGVPKSPVVTLQSPAGLQYAFITLFPNGEFLTYSTSPGGRITVTFGATVPPGQTIYYQVRGLSVNQYSATESYNFSISY